MANKPFTATKEYENVCFILTDRKLSRIVEVIKERLDRVKGAQALHEFYEIAFRDGKELRVDSLDSVLGLDNSNKTPITSIRASFEIKNEVGKVDFGIKTGFSSKDKYEEPMYISAISKELGWLQETMGAIEEQLERTIPNDFAYSFNRSKSAFLVTFFAVLFAALSVAFMKPQTPLNLPDSRIEELIKLSSSAKSEVEKNDFVFKYLSATLEQYTRAEKIQRIFRESRTYLIGIPSLIAIISAAVAIFWFYPRNIFAWGDCGESYEKIIERRKFIWYGVVFSLIIGVLGNLFVVGATA